MRDVASSFVLLILFDAVLGFSSAPSALPGARRVLPSIPQKPKPSVLAFGLVPCHQRLLMQDAAVSLRKRLARMYLCMREADDSPFHRRDLLAAAALLTGVPMPASSKESVKRGNLVQVTDPLTYSALTCKSAADVPSVVNRAPHRTSC